MEEKKIQKPSASRRKKTPTAEMETKAVPQNVEPAKENPPTYDTENAVKVGDTILVIKPTKLKYQRNRTALFYKFLEVYPLVDILGFQRGAFNDDRDGDKALMDWLIAVTDNEEFVTGHYDEFDTEIIERLLEIFKRLNKIDEKEEKQKNLERTLGNR